MSVFLIALPQQRLLCVNLRTLVSDFGGLAPPEEDSPKNNLSTFLWDYHPHFLEKESKILKVSMRDLDCAQSVCGEACGNEKASNLPNGVHSAVVVSVRAAQLFLSAQRWLKAMGLRH